MSKHSEQLPLNWTVPFMLLWKDVIKLWSLGWLANLRQDLKKSLPADQVEGFCDVDEGNVEGPFLFTIFLLQLSDGENHVHRRPVSAESGIATRDKQAPPVSGGRSASPGQRSCRRCSEERCPCGCCNHSCRPCSHIKRVVRRVATCN